MQGGMRRGNFRSSSRVDAVHLCREANIQERIAQELEALVAAQTQAAGVGEGLLKQPGTPESVPDKEQLLSVICGN